MVLLESEDFCFRRRRDALLNAARVYDRKGVDEIE